MKEYVSREINFNFRRKFYFFNFKIHNAKLIEHFENNFDQRNEDRSENSRYNIKDVKISEKK